MSSSSARTNWIYRFILSTAQQRVVCGLSVRCMRPVRKVDQFPFEKLCEAVRLLAATDPIRFTRLQRDVNCVCLVALPTSLGEYWTSERACVISQSYCDRPSVSAIEIAGVLVHEATHARLQAAGFKTTADNLLRIEQVCINAELRFASKLLRIPNAIRVRKNAALRLKKVSVLYDPKLTFDRHLTGLARSGVPAWIIRWLRKRRPVA